MPRGRVYPPAAERFAANCASPDENGCIRWLGALSKQGYGTIKLGGGRAADRKMVAHKFGWEMLHGPVPDGLELDHLCRNTWCVNHKHLEAVTHSVNVRRGMAAEGTRRRAAAITHCPHGHEYAPENTYRDAAGGRHCRTCKRITDKKRDRRKVAA